MPVQALDHATGYLLAAAVLRALACRAIDGGGWIAELSLAQTAAWLLRRPIAAAAARDASTDPGQTAERQITLGALRYALPPVVIDGGPRDWARPVGPWGADAPEW
jgi:crotonobetainyl-CoA:carnitine CoA-transferase CaiB-like acyl-CoA transferase